MVEVDVPSSADSRHETASLDQPASKHIPALDGVRGLAILLVLLHHFSGGADQATAIGRGWISLTSGLWIGVDLFFVLSGFLITGILLDSKRSTRYFRNFYARRSLRIFPLYYGVLLAMLIAFPFLHYYVRQEVGREFYSRQAGLWLYLTNFVMAARGVDYYWAFDHFWSLAVEEHFYLLWPLAIYLCSRRGALRLCVIVSVLALAFRIVLTFANVSPASIYILTPCRMDALAVGGLAALLVRGSLAEHWFRWARPIAVASGIALICLAVARHGLSQHDPVIQTAGYSVLAIFFAALLLRAVAVGQNSLLGRFWTLPPLRFTGKLAYGLYVFHPFFIIPLDRLFDGPHGRTLGYGHLSGIVLFAAFGIGASLSTAFLSWHLYEKHFLRLKVLFEYDSPSQPDIPEPLEVEGLAEAVSA